MPSLLQKLNLPEDLKQLTKSDMDQLAIEIRDCLIKIGDHCGGHLASNLGVVELTIALHSVLDSPTDKIVWDTSHQCYVHKILTGRLDQIMTIRQLGGLSGFAKISESDHDQFGAGHASTALSAGLGMAAARNIMGDDYAVFAIIGDATLSGGMAFEALNNVEKLKSNFVCVLNDNDMSISHPIGNMATYITKLRTSDGYNRAKEKFEGLIDRIPHFGVPLKQKIERIVDRIRDSVIEVKIGVIFEEFGFRYLGPLDGHNIPMLMAAFKYAKSYPGPIMIHVITTKGKGHAAAENDPIRYHGIAPPSPKSDIPAPPTYTQIFGKTVVELAETHPKLAVITPAMTEGSGLREFANRYPSRFFDVGIAEEHAVTFAAGLARCGIRPILAIYSTFMQRGYDQLIHDVCLQNLPVIFALDRAGLTGEDGATHHGVFDIAFALPIPNLTILAPKDGIEFQQMLEWSLSHDGPVSIRYPKGPSPVGFSAHPPIAIGKCEVMDSPQSESNPPQWAVIAVGSMVADSVDAIRLLGTQIPPTTVINLRFIKPLDIDTLSPILSTVTDVWIIEAGQAIGGAGGFIHQTFSGLSARFHTIGIPDMFIDHGNIGQLHDIAGLTASRIAEKLIAWHTNPENRNTLMVNSTTTHPSE